MKKIVKLTESDLIKLTKKVIKEQGNTQVPRGFENNLDGFMKWHDSYRGRRENFDFKQQGENFVAYNKLKRQNLYYNYNPRLRNFNQIQDTSKQDLIEILRNRLNSMEKENKYDATMVADAIINDCNQFKTPKYK